MSAAARLFARQIWRKAAWWAAIYLLMALIECAFFPAIRSNAQALSDLLNNLPAGMRQAFGGHDLTHFLGWLQTEFFSYFPLLAAIATSLTALDVLLRERDRRTLEEWLALPLARGPWLLCRVAVWAGVNLLALVPAGVLLWIMARVYGEPVTVAAVAATVIQTFAVAAACGCLVLLISAGLRDLGGGLGLALAVPFGLYMAQVALAAVGKALWVQRLLPFDHYNPGQAMAGGPWAGAAVGLILTAAVATALTQAVFALREPAA